MPSAVRRLPAALLFALAAGLVASGSHPRPASAQPEKPDAPKTKTAPPAKAKKDAEPTADAVKALADTFRAERAAALKAKFAPATLARADELADKAAAALKDGNLRAAARYYRDARWQVPFLPVNLPPHVVRVFGENRMRHAERVNEIAYSPDGTTLASASGDGTVKVWDLGNGHELVTYRGHAEQAGDATRNANVLKVGGVAFHPKGAMVASVGGAQVHLWDPKTGKQLKVLATIEKEDRPLKSVAFSPDGAAVAVGGDDGVVRVYAADTGKELFKSPGRNARIERLAYSPNGKLIGVADSLGLGAVYAPAAPNPMLMSIQVIDRGMGETLGVGFTADGSGLFTCGKDNKARLTAGPKEDGTSPPNTTAQLKEYVGHGGTVTDLAVTPDGKTLVTGSEDKTVRVWEASSGKQFRSFQGHMKPVTAVAVRGDGRQVASASEDGAIRLWDLNPTDDHKALADATGPVWAVAVTADGKRAAAAGADKAVRVYDLETGTLEATLTGHTHAVTSLAFFPDGARLASAGGDKVVRVWDVREKKTVREIPGHESPVLAVALSEDGKLLVTGAADKTARAWDPDTGKPLWTWAAKSAVCAAAVRAGGKQVAVGTADGTFTVLDVAAGAAKEAAALTAHVAGVAGVAYSPDGTKLATVGGDGALQVWTAGDGGQPALLTRFEGQVKLSSTSGFSPLSAVAFAPDGRFVATGGADAVVRVWDVQTKSEVRGLRGHAEWVTAVGFGAGGRLLVSAGADKKVLVFELTPQEGIASAGHLLKVHAVAVSADGATAATASVDQTIKLWDVATGRELGTLVGGSKDNDVPYAVAFLGAGRVASGGANSDRSTGSLYLWQTAPPRLLNSLTVGKVYTVAALADGSKVAAWSARPVVGDGMGNRDGSIYEVFDRDGKSLATVPDPGRIVRAATFSADLAWAVAGDATGHVAIWDLAKKAKVGDDWPVFQTEFADLGLTADKKLLVAADDKGVVKVADVAKRAVLATGTAHKAGVRGLLVSPTGGTFVTLGGDREIKAWALGAAPTELKEVRSWTLPTEAIGAAYAPDGKTLVTANADGTAYVLEVP